MDAKRIILERIDQQDEELCFIAKEIWDHPQVALEETFASQLLAEKLAADGFEITWGAGGMPTAFTAEWGQGAPLIGFLGEYDALPGLSQELSSEKEPINDGGPGHGCGHKPFRHGLHGLGNGLEIGDATKRDRRHHPLLWLPRRRDLGRQNIHGA